MPKELPDPLKISLFTIVGDDVIFMATVDPTVVVAVDAVIGAVIVVDVVVVIVTALVAVTIVFAVIDVLV